MPLIVYHQISEHIQCDDGFCSAFIFWLKYGYSAEYMPAMYHKRIPLETFRGKEVFIVDFCYPKDYLDAIQSVATKLVVLDHHDSASRSLQGSWYAHVDVTKSSCELVWEFLFPGKPMPVLVQQVRSHAMDDADRYTRAFIARLRSMPYTFDSWSSINNSIESKTCEEYKSFVLQGMAFLEGHDVQCRQLEAEAFKLSLKGVHGLAINAPKFFAKDVGRALAERSGTFGAVFFFREDNYVQFELYSKGFNVESLALQFNGGGHTTCAGFSIGLPEFLTVVDSSSAYLPVYAQIHSLLHTFKYEGARDENSVTSTLVEHLSAGGVSDSDLEKLEVSTAVEHDRSFRSACVRSFTRLGRDVLRLPAVSHEKKWYHRVFPYTQEYSLEFDDAQIAALLRLSKQNDDAQTMDFIASSLSETVKRRYTARMLGAKCVAIVLIRFSGSSIYIKRTFEI